MQFLITSIIFLFFALPSFAQNSDDEGTSRLAPNFYLEDLDNNIIELNSLVGNAPILLCFWSSCCKSAVMQLEAFSGLYDEYKNEGFIILAIAVDEENTVAKVKPYARSKKYKFPVLYDSDGNVSRLYYAYDVPFSRFSK